MKYDKNLGRVYKNNMEDNLNDASAYGEFVSTFHYWTSSEEQKARAEHLQDLGKENEDR